MKKITKDQKTITDFNGVFYRAMETEFFIYFVNFNEGDDNGNTKMFKKESLELIGDNYFCNQSLFEDYARGEHTWLSKRATKELKMWEEEIGEEELEEWRA